MKKVKMPSYPETRGNNMTDNPVKTNRGTDGVPPNDSTAGCVIGSPKGRKSYGLQNEAYKHEGLVIGTPQVVKPKETPRASSINRLPGDSTNILG